MFKKQDDKLYLSDCLLHSHSCAWHGVFEEAVGGIQSAFESRVLDENNNKRKKADNRGDDEDPPQGNVEAFGAFGRLFLSALDDGAAGR